MTIFSKGRARLTGITALTTLLLLAQPAPGAAPKEPYSPYATRPYPTRVYWGDTHLHTYVSFDAGAIGNGLNQRDAYRFARGEEVVSSHGERVRLSRPLDFLVVSDHAENYGVFRGVHDGNPFVLLDSSMRRLRSVIGADRDTVAKVVGDLIQEHATRPHTKPGFMKRQIMQYYWDDFTRIADQYNEPGRFTAFIGYEYTSMPGGDNLHRNVIFRDGSRLASRILPFSTDDSENPEDLWKVLEAYERDTGGRVLAIPHNSNLSNGRMFTLADFYGRPMTRAYAERRARWEPIVEATQIKGDSESHPSLSLNDEFAGYERWDFGNLAMTARKKPGMIQYEYARQALKNGLMLEQKLGANPFKFGMIGSTDSHTALAAVEENNFFGKHSLQEPTAERTSLPVLRFKNEEFPGWAQASSGYAAVWARENTREALFDAMMRREVYATTGSRMTVRVFGGWQFTPADLRAADVAVTGYRKGVPMGGDLRRAPAGRVPSFMIMAAKDPIGGNLDRVQVIKGWLDAAGQVQEKVFDVAWSGDRKPDASGRLPPVGNTVDLDTVTWTNTIGAPELATVWTDPEFDPKLRAFYYVRVIEIPTPRWTAYDVKRFGLKPDPKIPLTTQERAYTSPIWYTP